MTYTRANGYYIWEHDGRWVITSRSPDETLKEPGRFRWFKRYDSLSYAVQMANAMVPNG